ncbi:MULTISPECIES: M28 family peptidase [Dyella]|uniref:M28 family peptidase n=2 Tax=Dyella TaxID=231454 RepID=A0A4R0YZZ1_9GAMM|nr:MULTISPECIES: M28 family peptidase [Dyella]TBR40012.1 M28 family peptidase [Dyella terrae]TCI12406.1 M28 family peptidase [Dyella soli]
MRRLIASLAMLGMLTACQHHPSSVADNSELGPGATTFSPGIMVNDLAAHVRVLSSEPYRHRTPGSASEQRTIEYLVQQFERIGVAPGNGDRWVQDVPFIASTVDKPDQVTLDVAGAVGTLSLAFGKDMVVNSPAGHAHSELDAASLVFVGYGIVAPEQHWDDYAGVDVHGKTVVILANDPGWDSNDAQLFGGRIPTTYGRWSYKVEQAALHGAAAALVIHDPQAAGVGWNGLVTHWSGTRYSDPGTSSHRTAIAGWLNADAARSLFAYAGIDFIKATQAAHERGFKAMNIPAQLSTRFDSTIQHGVSHNVIAKVVGSKKPDEAIIFSTHTEDAASNPHLRGPTDSAAGLGGLLEMAEAFAHKAPKAHRTVYFIAFTMEGSGLLGSQYYVKHPVISLDHTIADINMDALPTLGPSRDAAVIGFGKSDLDDYFADALRAQHRRLTPADMEVQGVFYRSDQLSFASHGVPVLYARSGLDLVQGGTAAGHKRFGDYLRMLDGDAPNDEAHWNLQGEVEDLRALFMVGGRLSMETTYPKWKAGADFARRPTSQATQ